MICPRCGQEMKAVSVADSGSNADVLIDGERYSIAQNVYHCRDCYVVARENVWDFEGTIFIYPEDREKEA